MGFNSFELFAKLIILQLSHFNLQIYFFYELSKFGCSSSSASSNETVIFKPKKQITKPLVETVAQIYDPRKVVETSNKWELISTMNTTKQYEKSFEILRLTSKQGVIFQI